MANHCTKASDRSGLINQDLIVAYILPYFVYVGIEMLLRPWAGQEVVYLARLIIVSTLVFWAFRWYVPITGQESVFISGLYGVGFGILGLVLWCVLCFPFVDEAQGEPWSKTSFILRFVASGFLVPLFEEWLMRGLVFRVALQWHHRVRQGQSGAFSLVLEEDNIAQVSPGDWTMLSMVIASLIFASGHNMEQWPAAFVYGILMTWLWIIRKDLISCMVAHGVTNMGLALYVLYSGQWGLW